MSLQKQLPKARPGRRDKVMPHNSTEQKVNVRLLGVGGEFRGVMEPHFQLTLANFPYILRQLTGDLIKELGFLLTGK